MSFDPQPDSGSPEGSAPDRLGEAQRALEQRPRLSARAAIAGGFGLAFLLVLFLTISGLLVLSNLRAHIDHLEATAAYESELLEARRYEKNYLWCDAGLSGNAQEYLDEALEYLHRARLIAERRAAEPAAAGWSGALRNLIAYRDLLGRLVPEKPTEEAIRQVREAGRTALNDATALSRDERRELDRTFDRTLLSSVVFLFLSLVLMGALATALSVRILRPIRRFVDYTRRIASGDFSPILPVRRYRDEFSNLAIAFNVMLAEIRERQKQLTQAGKLAALGTLTSGIAHELNNPLNNISLTAGALRDAVADGHPEELDPLVEDIFTQVDRASGTVRNLLDFTRQEKTDYVEAAVGAIVRTAARLVRNEAGLNRVELDVEVPEDLPPVRVCVRDLEQVFLNLFLNAIQAMPAGGTLRVRGERGEEDTVRVRVGDDGVGIRPEDVGRIFDPFFTTKDVGEGTGLGLTVTHRLVAKHRGRIEVESEVGRGTTFTVVLPRRGPPESGPGT